MCIVYCITNKLNGKRYVGWTKKTLEKRWQKHIVNALVRNRRFLLSIAIRKYGIADDIWCREILVEGVSVGEAKQLEIKFIAELNTCALTGGIGYNMTPGGDGGTLSGAANPFYGRHHSAETIEKMRQTLGDKLSGENNPQFGLRGELSPNWGRKHSEESKRKRSEKLKGKKRTVEQRARMREANAQNRENRSRAQQRRREKERLERESLHQSSTS